MSDLRTKVIRLAHSMPKGSPKQKALLATLDDAGMKTAGQMPWVEVIFRNPKYNYTTSVSKQTTEAQARRYFVGQEFDVGVYPEERMERAIDIKYHLAD